jgi:beta-glucanase (GH16 family)
MMKKFSALFLPVLFICVAPCYALPPAAAEYTLAWSDEFNGTALDTTSWSYANDGSCYCSQMQTYTRSCVTVENGSLVIWSKHSPDTAYRYWSGFIDSHDKRIFTYGYFEASIRAPVGQVPGPGLWSSVWLLGNSIEHGVAWPTCGEMELYDQRPSNIVVTANSPQPVPATIGDNEFITSCHYGVNGGASYHSCQHNYSGGLQDRFHTYGILWDSLHVEYYFDDTLFWGVNFPIVNETNFGVPDINLPENKAAFHAPFYWVINVAIGGAYQGQNINNAIFPAKMELDYVRVYQKGATNAVRGVKEQQGLQPFVLVSPSTAQLKVYDLSGKLVADFSGRLKSMRPGDAVMQAIDRGLRGGIYVAKLVDNGKRLSRKFVAAR